ncbi:MAG: family 20 glycosylhydrolase, partial [Planctomycetota bacterium]
SAAAGAFYGVQTIRQLLPTEVFSRAKVAGVRWTLPSVTITDAPRFGWRGLMTDPSRHFLNLDTTRRLLDLMALHKLNVFHWHLVDGHGWRVEIRKYPRLTSVGGFRHQPPIGRHGGFYTQAEVRELVQYALDRNITIVPEIEMPGHSRAACAAYPFLACQDDGVEVGYFFAYPCPAKSFPKLRGSNVLCAGRETTFEFLEAVLKETFELFPSEFIHVGGDEVGKGFWKKCPDCQRRMRENDIKGLHRLQSYFMQRMEKFINRHGRRMIGWDEILSGGLAENATVMSWRGEGGGIKAAKMGHDAVMTPQKPLYFDHGQGKGPQPKHWPGTETLEEVYSYNPIPAALTGEQAKHVLGCQGNIWGAFVHSDEVLDCQAWPRGCALAETAWSPQASKDLADFKSRLARHKERLDMLNVSYYVEPVAESPDSGSRLTWSPQTTPATFKRVTWSVEDELVPGERYEIEFRYRRGRHGLDVRNVVLRSGRIALADAHAGFTGSRNRNNVWLVALPKDAPASPWTLEAEIQGSAGTSSTGEITIRKDTGRSSSPWRRRRIVPDIVTTTAVAGDQKERGYDWMARHRAGLESHKAVKPDIIWIGDSIVHYWSGEPAQRPAQGEAAWDRLFAGRAVTNMGFAGDLTQNALWRVRNGELDGIAPNVAMILIGGGNLEAGNTPREIYWGVQAIVDEIHKRCPGTKVLLVGLLPRRRASAHTPERVNNLLATLNDRRYVRFYNVNYHLLDKDGLLRADLYRDEVHPNAKGYDAIAEALKPVVDELTK